MQSVLRVPVAQFGSHSPGPKYLLLEVYQGSNLISLHIYKTGKNMGLVKIKYYTILNV